MSCYQCRQEVDQYNRTISCHAGCFEGEEMEQYLKECPNSSDSCVTEFYVDWLPVGQHKYTMYRNCSAKEYHQTCTDGSVTTAKFKDCMTSCNTTACNDGDEAFEVFIQHNPSNIWNCYSCEAEYFLNGTVIGDSNCANMTEMNRQQSCPRYAENSCSTSGIHFNYHDSTEAENNFVYRVSRACSPFDWDYDNFVNWTFDGWADIVFYKDSCTPNNCNNQSHGIDNDVDVYCRYEHFIEAILTSYK